MFPVRTVVVGEPNDRQKELYAASRDAIEAIEQVLVTGNTFGTVFDTHARIMDERGLAKHRLNACGYSVGARFDLSEEPVGPSDRQRSYSAFATWYPSEFQRLRFQIDQVDAELARNDQRFTLQWTAFLGSHRHGFATR